MAFTSQLTAKPTAATPAPSSGLKGLLSPDPVQQAELEDRGPGVVAVATESAHVKALRTMNAVRTLAPILATAVASGGDDRQQATRFSELLSKSTALAVETLRAMDIDPAQSRNRWMVNVLERGFAEVVATGQEISPTLPSLLAKELPNHALDSFSAKTLSPENAIPIAIFQAMLPIVSAQLQFDFFRNRNDDLLAARDLLIEEVAKSMESLLAPMTATDERVKMMSLLCQEGGRALADAWLSEAERAKEALSRKTTAEVNAWRRANPQGFPIDTVHKRFRETMHRIRVLSKISPSQ